MAVIGRGGLTGLAKAFIDPFWTSHIIRPLSSAPPPPLNPNQQFNEIISKDYAGATELESTLKVVQRFKRDPSDWPVDELPFGLTHIDFVGKTMHPIELRPERAFANFVPLRPFALRHLGRMLRARMFHKVFSGFDIFDQKAIIEGTRRAFQLLCQSIHKDELNGLVKRKVCNEMTVKRFEIVRRELSPRQHELLDLTEEDIISIAPGVLGPFQNIRQVLRDNMVHLSYSILCCAFYKKKILFDSVSSLPLLSLSEPAKEEQFLPLPPEYGYISPRLVFAYIEFSHQMDSAQKVDPNVNLFDFQFLVL